jgi:hypothetical protein
MTNLALTHLGDAGLFELLLSGVGTLSFQETILKIGIL